MAASVRAVFPAGTTATTSATTSVTTSVTVVAGDVLEAHVVVSAGSDSGLTLSATANGAAADGSSGAVHSNTQTAGFEQVFYWTAPATGTYNVVSTVAGGTPDALGQKVYAIAGTDSAAPTISSAGTPNDVTNRTAAAANAITIPNNGIGISHFCAGTAFSSTGQTTQLNDNPGGSSAATAMCGASAAGTGGSVTFTATISAGDWYAVVVTVWAAAGAATTPEQYAAHWKLVPPGGLSPASPRMFPFPAFGTGDTTPNTAQATTWFTAVDDTTTPELIVSAEDWGLLANGALNHAGDANATYDDYFTQRAAQGYNAVEVSLFGYSSLSNNTTPEGGDSDGIYPFTTNTNPSTSINTTWWDRRDYFLSSAASNGFRVFLNVTTPNLSFGCFATSWTVTQWQDLGTKLGTRYGTQSNIMWMLCDDYFGEKDVEITAFLAALRAAGGNQPVSIQYYQETSSRKDIYDGTTRTWGNANAQFNFGYSYNVSYDVVEKMGLEASPLPYGWFDGFFLASGSTGITDTDLTRRMVWWALSSGAKAFQVGDNDMWTWASSALGQIAAKSFYTSQVPAISTYFRSLPNWHQLKADTSSVLVTGGRGTHASAIVSGGSGTPYTTNSDSYVTASFIQSGLNAGELAVIYMSHASTITIDESKMVAGYTATWVDPASGATSAATPGTTYNSGSKGTNSVGDADWVLVLADPGSSVTGTLSATLPVVTGSVAGDSLNAGTTSASVPKVTGSVTGQSVNTGTLAATLPVVTGAITGASVNAGTTSGTLPVVTGAITGTATNAGTTSGTLPKVTAALAGDSTNTGTVSASLPLVTGSLADTTVITGTLSATLPPVTGSVAGTATNSGTLSANLPPVTSSISDTTVLTGTLVANLSKITGTIAGESANLATLLATLPKVTGLAAGDSVNPATLSGTLPLITGTIAGTATNVGTLAATLPKVTSLVTDMEPRNLTATATLTRTRSATLTRHNEPSATLTRRWTARLE